MKDKKQVKWSMKASDADGETRIDLDQASFSNNVSVCGRVLFLNEIPADGNMQLLSNETIKKKKVHVQFRDTG